MITKNQISIAMVILTGVILGSCNLKKKNTFDSDSGVSYSTVDNLFKDINKTITAAADENNLSGKTNENGGITDLCASVTLSPNDFVTFPKTVTVDFGTLGCTDQNGVTRKGVVTAVFTDYLNNPGARVNVTFQNYYVNGVKAEGNYALTNTSTNSSTRSFADTITNAKATTADGKVCTWNATRSSVQTAGFSTLVISDDEYTGQGKSSGIGFNGKSFSAVSSNIVWRLNCKYIVSGTVNILSGSDPEPVIVDFGNGLCDNKYKVSYDIYHADLQFWY